MKPDRSPKFICPRCGFRYFHNDHCHKCDRLRATPMDPARNSRYDDLGSGSFMARKFLPKN